MVDALQTSPEWRRLLPMIHHLVLLRFKPDVAEDRIQSFLQMVADLQRHIPGMEYCASGKYSSPEGLNQGYTHGILITFDTAASRDEYLIHPEHEQVKQSVLPHLDAVVAFDFEA